MDLETLRQLCLSFPKTTEDLKWGADLCMCVGKKMFLVMGPDAIPVWASFKVNAEEFEELAVRPGFKPSPYLARYKWVAIDDISRLSPKEWQYFAHQAYNLVREKLPKKIQKELGFLA